MYMTQGLRRAAKLTPDATAMISETHQYSWFQFQDRVARLAGALLGLGLCVGDRVAMLSFNSSRYAEYYYGVFWAVAKSRFRRQAARRAKAGGSGRKRSEAVRGRLIAPGGRSPDRLYFIAL